MSKWLGDSSLRVWRAARDAQPEGLTSSQIYKMENAKGDVKLTDRLQHMKLKGYLRYEGAATRGVWRVGPVLPLDESPVIGAPAPDPSQRHRAAEARQMRKESLALGFDRFPAGVPNSVFALAQTLQGATP